MSNTTGVLKEEGTAYPSRAPGFTPVCGGFMLLILLFAFCVVFFCIVCLRPVSCVPYVACFFGWSILDFSFGFTKVYK